MNTVPQVWASGACTNSKMYISQDGSLTEFVSDVNASAFIQDMENADVTVKVSFTGTTIYVYAVMEANGRTYVYPYTHTIDQQDKIYAHICVDNSYITDFYVSDEVAAVSTVANVAYDSSCPEDKRNNCFAEAYTLEGLKLTNSELTSKGLAENWLVGVGDVIGFRAWPTNRFITWGNDRNSPTREVEVNGSNHITDGIVKPTATFGGYETISFTMTPNPYYTYVGATNIGRADINGLPGIGWSNLTAWTTGDSQIASISNNEWVLGGKAGKVTATIKMAECVDETTKEAYNEAQASYDLIVKPGRVSGSTAKYSVDFTHYLNESEIQAAFGGYNATSGNPGDGYLNNVNISNDVNVSLVVKAQALNGTNSSSGPSIRLSPGGSIDLSANNGTLSSVKIIVGSRSNSSAPLRYYLNGNTRTLYTADINNGVVEISNINASSIKIIHPGGSNVHYIQSIDAEYTAEAGFSETSVRYNIADLKKSATEVPQLIGMIDATYTSANTKIVKVNSDGSLVFLKTGRTSIKAEANGVTKSYDIEIYADAAEFSVSNDGAKYTYQVTKAGMLPTNSVASIPGITMTYGSYGETPLVANHANSTSGNGLGIAVIGSASGNEGSIAPIINSNKFAAGTYYLFTPTISGTLSVSGYFEGSHSAWFCEYTDAGIASTYQMAMTRDAKALVTGAVNVEGGKTYCLYCPLDENNRVENYFMLNSFSFTASMKLAYQSYIIPNKTKTKGEYYVSIPEVEGKGTLQPEYSIARIIKYNEDDFIASKPEEDTTQKTWVEGQPDDCKNPASNLSAEIVGNQVKIISNNYEDGGAVVVNVKVGESVLPYVITVPYIGKHVWNFHNMKNKQENRESASWFFDWEVKNGTYIKDPIVLAQEQVQGNNAMMIDQTNGLYITTTGHSQMGLYVIATSNDVESLPQSAENAQTQRSTQIDVVRNVNLVVLKGADVTIPQVKKDWFVKIYLDPHTGNFHKDGGIGNGCEFSVTNARDLRGNLIDPTHVIMSYGTQWTRSVYFDDKTSFYGYAGCLIFRAAEDGDVTFNFKENGWDKIVKIEVTNTYSTEMELGTTNLDGRGNNPVDYARWNHSWVHRVHTDGTGNGITYTYDGHPRCHAENAKPIDYTVVYNHGTVNTTVVNEDWTADRGNVYNKGVFTSNNGVGNVKILSQATYNAYSYNGGWHDTGTKYVLNSEEQWIVVGKITEQQYPKTWDFTRYNMGLGTTTEVNTATKYKDQTNPIRTWTANGETLTCNSDTTYGYWNNNYVTNFCIKDGANKQLYASGKYVNGVADFNTPFYTIGGNNANPDDRTKAFNVAIPNKPLWANGAELTYGFETIPETEGLGIILGWDNDPSRNLENVTLDGEKLKIEAKNSGKEGGIFDIVIPNVTEGMYVFVKSSNAPTISPLYNEPETGLYAKTAIVSKATLETSESNFGFERNHNINGDALVEIPGGNVTVFKVTQTGDVVLRFNSNTEIYKIGVTNETKQLTYYGYATESRAMNIDYNETRYFSANMESFYVTKVDGWNNRKGDLDEILEVRTDAETNLIQNQQYIEHGTGIILHDKEIEYNKDYKNQFDGGNGAGVGYKVPLFVPACNIPAEVASNDEQNGSKIGSNLLKGSTDVEKPTTDISTSLVEANHQYYTMTIRYKKVADKDNAHLSDYVYTDIPRFYRYIGTSGSYNKDEKLTLKNLAYLEFSGTNVKSFSDYIKFDFETEKVPEATDIEETEIIDNNNDAGTIYNLRGQAVNGMPSTRGIYIKNGKKYLVK